MGVECDRPSHQLIVEVTGAQNPSSGRAGGYLNAGKPNTIFAATDTRIDGGYVTQKLALLVNGDGDVRYHMYVCLTQGCRNRNLDVKRLHADEGSRAVGRCGVVQRKHMFSEEGKGLYLFFKHEYAAASYLQHSICREGKVQEAQVNPCLSSATWWGFCNIMQTVRLLRSWWMRIRPQKENVPAC